MKIRINFLCILAAFLMLSVVSCKKDETMVVATPSTAINLTASSQTLVLTEPDSANTAVTLSWNKADFGYAAAITYTLQISYKDSSFRKVASVGEGTSTSASFTVADLNTLLLGAKYTADQAGNVQVRILARVADSLYAFSDTMTLNITPYVAKRVISYAALYVPGSYQGWAPGSETIAKLYSAKGDGAYKGYVNLTEDTSFFKFTNQADWNGINYGTGGKGLLSTISSAGNLEIDSLGYYLVTADTKALAWTATIENWGIVGDAADGWDNDIMFDFDAENQVLTKTVVLKAGGLKFRANHNWTLNIGEHYAYGAANNITISEAGTYEITLDLRVPDEPVVTMTLQ